MNASNENHPEYTEAPKPQPTGRWCKHIDAEAILNVAEGRLSLSRPIAPACEPLEADTNTVPLAAAPTEGYRCLQPEKNRFDASDIFRLSRVTHPWQAEPIEKKSEEESDSDQVAKAG